MSKAEKEYTKKDLGQYFTPKAVVDFTLEIARKIAGPKLDKSARVIDPACGAGTFLLSALQKGIGNPKTIFGIDIDPSVKAKWESNGLATTLGRNLYIQNGIYDTEDGRISEKLPIRKFDLVVGNPPYGGIGVRGVQEDKKLLQTLKAYELWRPLNNHNYYDQERLFTADIWNRIKRLTPKEVERLERFPIEVLFVERFVRLARDGGIIAIIITDGILANIKFNFVRNWIAEHCQVSAIVSLPRGTFRGTGTTAKTSLLFLKRNSQGTIRGTSVFMAQLKDGSDGGAPTKGDLDTVLTAFKDKDRIHTHNSPVIWRTTTTDDLWDNRWDPEYWDPTLLEPIEKVKKAHKTALLGDLIKEGVSGYRGKTEFARKGIRVLEVRCIRELGVDFKEGRYVKKGGPFDKPQYYIKEADVLIVRSGVASAGRVISVAFIPETTVICGDIYKIVLDKKCDPGYFAVLMQSNIGTLQFERVKAGIASTKIDVVDIKNFVIPLPPKQRQKKTAEIYAKVFSEFNKAMETKHEIAGGKKTYSVDGVFVKHFDRAKSLMEEAVKDLNDYFFG